MKILFACLILSLCFQFSLAQEKPKAKLADEIPKTDCGDLSNRIMRAWQSNNFDRDKNSELYLVVKGKPNIWGILAFERMARGEISDPSNNLDESRIKFFRSNRESEVKIEVWIVPKDADTSFLTENQLDLSKLKLTKPEVFYHSLKYIFGCSNYIGFVKNFSEILLANPELRGHIVIFENSAKKFGKTEKELLSEFTEKLNIPRNQLKTFFIKQPKDYMPYYELWLVPKKSRN